MLRIYFLQQWFNLSDSAVEEALYDAAVMRHVVGLDLDMSRRPTKLRSASFGTCWKNTNWENRSWAR
jgi:IS5 family transposase